VRHTLVCLPFAGAGAGFYRTWKDLPDDCPAIVPLQLPGREERFLDELHHDVIDAAAELTRQLAGKVAGTDPLCLFGHSLGAVLAFEIALQLERATPGRVRHLFVSGSPGPWSGRAERATGLDDEQFIAQVQRFAGYRHDALADPDLREVLLPTLRADVEMHENYKPAAAQRLTGRVTALRGDTDELVSHEQVCQWREATTGAFDVVEVSGPHMYLVESPLILVEAVTRALGEG
jgi:surfactin synthase thioesterase subunit